MERSPSIISHFIPVAFHCFMLQTEPWRCLGLQVWPKTIPAHELSHETHKDTAPTTIQAGSLCLAVRVDNFAGCPSYHSVYSSRAISHHVYLSFIHSLICSLITHMLSIVRGWAKDTGNFILCCLKHELHACLVQIDAFITNHSLLCIYDRFKKY